MVSRDRWSRTQPASPSFVHSFANLLICTFAPILAAAALGLPSALNSNLFPLFSLSISLLFPSLGLIDDSIRYIHSLLLLLLLLVSFTASFSLTHSPPAVRPVGPAFSAAASAAPSHADLGSKKASLDREREREKPGKPVLFASLPLTPCHTYCTTCLAPVKLLVPGISTSIEVVLVVLM